MPKYILPFLIAIFSLACSIRKFAVRQVVEVMEESRRVFEGEIDLELARSSLSGNLKLLEALLEQDVDNLKLRLFLTQAYSGYTLAFVEDEAEEKDSQEERKRAQRFYARAKNFLLPWVEQKLGKIKELPLSELQKNLQNLGKEDVPFLFWYAFSWGSEINLSREELANFADLPKLELLMQRVKELDEAYYFGGVYLFEGIYYGSRGEILGGNLERAKKAFEKALFYSQGKFLMSYYYKAATYCVFAQDISCFVENVNYVLNAPEDIFPEQGLANALAKKKATRLWQKKDELFIEN